MTHTANGGEKRKAVCKYCGLVTMELELIQSKIDLPNGGYHLKGSCPNCKNYVKFIKHREEK